MSHSNKLPIWITNWVIGYTGGRGNKIEPFNVAGVIAKGKDEEEILENKDALRRAVWVFEQGKKSTKVSRKQVDEVVDKYIAISVELIKQIGFGVIE